MQTKLIGATSIVADALHLIGRWARLLIGSGMEKSHENDRTLSKFVLQRDMSSREIIPSELRLLDKKDFIFIPAGNLNAVATAHYRRVQNRHDYLHKRKSSSATKGGLKKRSL